MTFEPQLRSDILPEALTEVQPAIDISYGTQYYEIVKNTAIRSRTTHIAKNIFEAMDLIVTAVDIYEEREDKVEDARVIVTYGDPDESVDNLSQDRIPRGIISLSLSERKPGAYGQGAPFESKVHNLRPILREEEEDPDNVGYRRAMLGYFYDNVVTATCWSRTNKMSNELMIWFETLMQELQGWFVFSGIPRVLYWGLGKEKKINIKGMKYYGREIKYFIRTEKIVAISEKKFEKLNVKLQRQADT